MDHSQSKISDFLSGVSIDALPDSVVHESKRALLDTLGCMIAGIDTPLGIAMTRLCPRFVDSDGSSAFGFKGTVAHFFAAMCNSFMANAHDADDGHRASRLHAGGIIIPTILTVAEEMDCNGSEFLEAAIIAYELGLRAGMISTGWETYHGSAFGTTLGASAAAGRLLNLPTQKIVNAMGICEIQAPNCMVMGWVRSQQIPMIKEGMGWSAATAVIAAYMAEQSITGNLTMFNNPQATDLLKGLGRDFEIEKRYYKPYPGCRWAHGPRQALMALIENNRLSPDQVESVEVSTFEKAVNLDNPAPANIEQAEYSIPYILGASLVDGDFSITQMTAEKIADSSILKQSQKVQLKVDPQADALYPTKLMAKITVKTKDGKIYNTKSKGSKGDLENPLSDKDMESKFIKMSSNRLNTSDAQTIIKSIWDFESETNVSAFVRNLSDIIL